MGGDREYYKIKKRSKGSKARLRREDIQNPERRKALIALLTKQFTFHVVRTPNDSPVNHL